MSTLGWIPAVPQLDLKDVNAAEPAVHAMQSVLTLSGTNGHLE